MSVLMFSFTTANDTIRQR